MRKLLIGALVFGMLGIVEAGYKESSFSLDKGETPRAIHYTANGFKANATYQLKFYVKKSEPLCYIKILSNDSEWLTVDEDSWPDTLPTFTTDKNGHSEGWVYVKNAGLAEIGTYTCAFSVRETASGEILKPGIFRPLTVMDMERDGGWLEGIVYKDGAPAEGAHVVFWDKNGKVVGSVDSEPNCIPDDNLEIPGYFKIALPAETEVEKITDYDGNLYELDPGVKIASQGGPWKVLAGVTLNVSGKLVVPKTGRVVINEIMYDAPKTVTDTYGEWVELCNLESEMIDLSGWILDDGKEKVIPTGTTISANRYLVLIESEDGFSTSTYNYDTSTIEYVDVGILSLDDTSDTLILKDSTGKIVDIVKFHKNWGGAGPDSGRTLEKILAAGPNIDENWDASDPEKAPYGTPGRPNSVSELGTICGTVKDTKENPIQNAKVFAIPKIGLRDDAFSLPGFLTYTNEYGSYTLYVPKGNYRVIANHPDYGRKVKKAKVEPGRTTELDFVLKKLGIIAGTVYGIKDGTKTALPGAYVEAIIRWRGGLHYRAKGTLTDTNGYYEIRGLKEGTYTVVAQKPEYKTEKQKAYVAASLTTTCDFELEYLGLLPDLTMKCAMSDIWWRPKHPRVGQRVKLFARVWNLGSETSGSTTVQFWQSNWGINQDWGADTEANQPQIAGASKHFLGSETLPPLAQGCSTVVHIDYYPQHPGVNNILVKIDPPIAEGGIVPELNELNNVFGRCILVKYFVDQPIEISVPIGNPLPDPEMFEIEVDAPTGWGSHLPWNQLNLSGLAGDTLTVTFTPGAGERTQILIFAKGERMGEIAAEIVLVRAEKIEEVGSDGGTPTAAPNFKVQIPEGALDKAVKVILNQNVDPQDLEGVEVPEPFKNFVREFLLEEDIGTFKKPVKITIPYPADYKNPGRLRVFYLNPDEDRWEMLPTEIDTANNALSAEVEHFSIFSAQEAEIATITITAEPSEIISVGSASLKAVAVDPNGVEIPGVQFEWNFSPTEGASLIPGTDTAVFWGTKAGTYIITASTETKTGTYTMVVKAGEPAVITLTAPDEVSADVGTATISAYVVDEQNNAVEDGVVVHWSIVSCAIPATSTTVDGTATAVATGLTKVGVCTITATIMTATDTTTIEIKPGKAAVISAKDKTKVGTYTETREVGLEVLVYDKNENRVTMDIPAIYWSVIEGPGTVTPATSTENTFCWYTEEIGEAVVLATMTETAEARFTIIRAVGAMGENTTPEITHYIPQYGGTVTVKFIGTVTEDCYLQIATRTPPSDLPGRDRAVGVCVEISALKGDGSSIGTLTYGDIRVELPYGGVSLGRVSESLLKLFRSENGADWKKIAGSGVDKTKKVVWGTVTELSLFTIGGGSGPELTLDNAFCYPNPCRYYEGKRVVTFMRLTRQAEIRIFNIAGEEVASFSKNSDTNYIEWQVPSHLASGVYIYLITNGGDKKVGKLGIIK